MKKISFSRSFIDEESCQLICSTIKNLRNVEQLNFSKCGLTSECAQSIANLIKVSLFLLYIPQHTYGLVATPRQGCPKISRERHFKTF